MPLVVGVGFMAPSIFAVILGCPALTEQLRRFGRFSIGPGGPLVPSGVALMLAPLDALIVGHSREPSSERDRSPGAILAAVPFGVLPATAPKVSGEGGDPPPPPGPRGQYVSFRPVEAARVASASPEYLRLARKAKLLSWVSLAYMAVEGIVAIVAGIVASSIALIGFGIDSAIEGFASVVIVWRFTGWRTLSDHAEERAQKLVAVQFFILAPYVAFESVRALVNGTHAEESMVGIALAASSLVLMPLLGRAKQRIGNRIGSSATASEGTQNLLCAYLAAALLVGLLGNALVGAWWLDPLVGLFIAVVAVVEGREAWRGDACCPH